MKKVYDFTIWDFFLSNKVTLRNECLRTEILLIIAIPKFKNLLEAKNLLKIIVLAQWKKMLSFAAL